MFKMFGCFCCITAFMISVAVDAGVGTDPSVKKNLGGIFWKQSASDISDADITLFMTADTLNRSNTCKRFVTTQTLFFQRLMPFHQRPWVKKDFGEGSCQSGKNYRCSYKNKL